MQWQGSEILARDWKGADIARLTWEVERAARWSDAGRVVWDPSDAMVVCTHDCLGQAEGECLGDPSETWR
jgi:hypothetical protein